MRPVEIQARAARVDALAVSPPTKHVAFIDALRGWAFLSVLMVHVAHIAVLPASIAQYGLFAANYGVQLFFVVSALTLLMSFQSRKVRDHRPIRAFFVRRFFRIAPLFWLAIPIYLVYNGTGPQTFAPQGIHAAQVISTIFFVHGWHPTSINSVVPGGWSIAAEMNFYVLFPLFVSTLTSLRRAVAGCALTLVPSVAFSLVARRWLSASYSPELIGGFTYYWLPRELPVFLLGFILFFLIEQVRAPDTWLARQRDRLRFLPEICVVLLLGMGYASERIPLAYFLFACIFVFLALGLTVRPIGLLVNQATEYVGKVSFSAYITHFLVLSVVGEPLVRTLHDLLHARLVVFIVVYVVCALVTVLLSTVTYRIVETPGQDLGRWVIDRLGYGRMVAPEPTAA
jgi:peptidoglycan/LPS O-acetylase OafA/YrhL